MIDSYNLNNQQQQQQPPTLGRASVDTEQEIKHLLAQEYINTVRENRSLHGSYIDNHLAKMPNKEKKSVYDVVYETDV